VRKSAAAIEENPAIEPTDRSKLPLMRQMPSASAIAPRPALVYSRNSIFRYWVKISGSSTENTMNATSRIGQMRLSSANSSTRVRSPQLVDRCLEVR